MRWLVCWLVCFFTSHSSESLYKGLGPVLTSLYCSNFVYFYSFSGMKMLASSKGLKPSASRDLVLGYLSGITATSSALLYYYYPFIDF